MEVVDHLVKKFLGVDREAYDQTQEVESVLEFTAEDVETFSNSVTFEDLAYFEKRGITKPSGFRLGKYTKATTRDYVTIPVFRDGELMSLKCRRNDVTTKDGLRYFSADGSNELVPYKLFEEKDELIFFVEDCFSAMSVKELGFPVASLCTGNAVPKRGRETYRRELQGKKIICIEDFGDSGPELSRSLKKVGATLLEVLTCPEPHKDFSDFIEADRAEAYQFLLELWNKHERLLQRA